MEKKAFSTTLRRMIESKINQQIDATTIRIKKLRTENMIEETKTHAEIVEMKK
jgi:DNA-binding transcriptional regulator GbsR (MarR family)